MKISYRVALATGVLALFLVGCSDKPANTAADSIYFNGSVITLDANESVVEAIAIMNGKILATGDSGDILQISDPNTRRVDLRGATIVPGFVDAHSHLSGVSIQAVTSNLLPAPDGPVNNIAALQQTLRDFMAVSSMAKDHGVVVGFNYANAQLEEGRHPNRHDLDAVSTDMPIVITHQSGHLGVYNSKALEMFGITAESEDPPGGVIVRETGGTQPNGVLEENAHFAVIYKMIPPSLVSENLAAAEMKYLSNGFTTIQDGKTDQATLGLMAKHAAAAGFYS